MRFSKKRFIISALAALAVIALAYGFAGAANAQINTGLDFGAQTGLANQDIRITIAKIIRIILGFLGTIALLLIMYAGYLWMTARGNEEKVDQAKTILKNGVIGLAIILSSFAIVSFVISRLLAATTGNGMNGNGNGGPGTGGGISGLGNGIVKSVYPEPFQKSVPINTSIIITFREPMQAKSICVDVSGDKCAPGSKMDTDSIKIFRTSVGDGDGNIKTVTVSSNDNQTFVFKPASSNYLGVPNELIDYTVNLTREIRKANGDRAFNLSDFRWTFETGGTLDFDSPKIRAVKEGGIFPPTDNEADTVSGSRPAVAATGTITVNGQPKASQLASAVITQTSPDGSGGGTKKNATVEGTNICEEGTITFSIISADGLKARVAYSQPNLIGGDLPIINNRFSLGPCGLTVVFANTPAAGNAWRIAVLPNQQADTLTVGSKAYSFVSGSANANQITIGATLDQTAENIGDAITAINPDMTVASVQNRVVTVKAKVAGSAGNNRELSSSSSGLAIGRMSGGTDQSTTFSVKDKKDQPKNATIQINFNEAINPLTVAGTSVEMAEKLRIVNADKVGQLDARAGAACTKDSDCLSFNCNGTCQGEQLAGTFVVSNQYKTVEFISDKKCGVNGCGENIYCLPPNSNLRVEAFAASLGSCSTNADCGNPFSSCIAGICQNSDKKNSPVAARLDGIADLADNSLDGNRNDNPQGRIDTWNENASANDNAGRGDNYRWSFWTNDKLDLTPPKIASTTVINNATRVPLSGIIRVLFTKLMLSASMSTGTITSNNGIKEVTHKLINVWSMSSTPIGYWVSKEDAETGTPDGQPDYTVAVIGHGIFADSTAYRSQVGSGVKDIYQNCFKPSASNACGATAEMPSCCRKNTPPYNLVPTNAQLTPDGN